MLNNLLHWKKKIKIATKRWDKAYSLFKNQLHVVNDYKEKFELQKREEIYINIAMCISEISNLHKNKPKLTLDCAIYEIISKENEYINRIINKNIQDGIDFAKAQNLNLEEHLKQVDLINENIQKNYNEQMNLFLDIFDAEYSQDKKSVLQSYKRINSVLNSLRSKNYEIWAIEDIKIINAVGSSIKIQSEKLKKIDSNYNFYLNGTYFIDITKNKYIFRPCGTIITDKKDYVIGTEIINVNGKNEIPQVLINTANKVKNRGGFALLDSGLVIIEQSNGNSKEEIINAFSEQKIANALPIDELKSDDKIKEFIGGGALIIKNGKPISGKDLLEIQKFDQSKENKKLTSGFSSSQLSGDVPRVIFGQKDEILYLIKITKKVKSIQKELINEGFDYVIVFDGGGGFYFDDGFPKDKNPGKDSPTGFAVRTINK